MGKEDIIERNKSAATISPQSGFLSRFGLTDRIQPVIPNVPLMGGDWMTGAKVHDLAIEPVSATVAHVVVDCPVDGRDRLKVAVRRDAVRGLEARGKLAPAQVRAALAWTALYERAHRSMLGAIDWRREPVSGGGSGGNEMRLHGALKAAERLSEIDTTLGEDAALVRLVLGRGATIAQAASALGQPGEWGARMAGRRFRRALDVIAVELGFST